MWLGIDFGTCFSSAALILDNGSLVRVKDPRKHGYSFPSSVYVESEDNFLIGYSAEFKRNIEPLRYRREFKRDLGSRTPYQLGKWQFMPEQLVAEILGKLRAEANKIVKAYGCETFKNAVVTIPATYQDFKNSLIQQAAENAGFEKAQLLPEPVAAAIYSAQKHDIKDGEITLVYDLGGGTFDSTLIQKHSTTDYQILGIPVGDSNCGGIDFDREIYADFSQNCSATFKELLNSQKYTKEGYIARSTVAEMCCDIKHQLSEDYEAQAPVILMGQIEYYNLSREKFNSLIEPYIDKTIRLCEQLVTNANLSWEKVDRILMVGGSCRIPYIQQILKEKLGRNIYLVDEPDLAVSLGAAIHAKQLDAEKYKKTYQNQSQINQQSSKNNDIIKEKQNIESQNDTRVDKLSKKHKSANYFNSSKEEAEAFYQEGITSIKLGNYQAAINNLWRSILINATKSKPYLYRGFAIFCLGNEVEATKHFDRAIQINPNISDAYVCYGLTNFAKQQYEKALKDFNQAINMDGNQGGYLGRCVTYTLLNRHKLAISDYEYLIKYAHSFDTNGYNRAIIKVFSGDREPILQYLKKANQAFLIELNN